MFNFGPFSRLYEENNEGAPGNGTPPVFDPVEFAKTLTSEFDKRFNAMDKKLSAALKPPAPQPETPKSEATKHEVPKPEGEKEKERQQQQAQNSPEYNALATKLRDLETESQRKISDLEKKTELAEAKAEKKERESIITSKLAGYKFRSEVARADAMTYFAGIAERDDSGDLVVGNQAITKYIEQEMGPAGSRSYMIAPAETGGSGAGKGDRAGLGKAMDLNDIQPGMSKEERERARKQIAALSVS